MGGGVEIDFFYILLPLLMGKCVESLSAERVFSLYIYNNINS